MTTTSFPEPIAHYRRRLQDYFSAVTDIAQGGRATFASKSCACSMEHINIVLDGEDLNPDPSGYSVHAMPADIALGSGWSRSMGAILVCFNDCVSEEVLRSDAWRLELLPRYVEATNTTEADLKRDEMVQAWLRGHGCNVSDNLTATSDGYPNDLYGFLEELTSEAGELPGALGVSAEELIAFLHTLICP